MKEQEMPVAGGAVRAAFIELSSLVKEVVETVAAFGPQLKKIESTLSIIGPIIAEIDESNERLQRPKELGAMKDLLEKGKELVSKCLRIHRFNLCRKYRHSNRLTEFDAEVLREFQIYIQLLDARNHGEILWELREVKELIHSGQACGRALRALQSGLRASGNLAAPEGPDFIVGLEAEACLRKIKERLLEEGVSVSLVTAPPGCGKTALVKKLCHDVDIEGKFNNNIMFIPISKKPNLTDIVQKMIQHKGFTVPMIETEDHAVKYLQQLLNRIGEYPVLLVLDDVWSKSQSILDKFKFNEIKDYKILVTSRNEFPAYRPVHHLNPLTHGDALELFRRIVTVDDSSMDPPDEKLLDQIVRRCKGLPLALTVVAKSLRGKNRSFWEILLLDWSEGHSHLSLDSDILNCLRKSLDDLDGDPSIKERFMDLGAFPEDCKIPATTLTDMWVELYQLDFDGVRAIADLQDLIYRNLAELVVTRRDSSDDDDKRYSSHYAMQYGLLRELAIMECNRGGVEKRERLILELIGNGFPDWWSKQKQQSLSARLVSICTDETFSSHWPNLELPEAEALVLNFATNMQTKTYALPEFIEKASKLKALIVTNYNFFRAELGNFHVIGSNLRRIRLERVIVPLLSMGNLRLHSLQKISFCMCEISQASTSDDANIATAMPNLLELDIEYCDNLVTLPDGICQIKPLRKLSLTNCHHFSSLPEQIGQLASLEVVGLNSCTNLSQLPDSMGSLQNLRFLDISDCLNLSTLPRQIGYMVNLTRINMRGCMRLSVLPPSIVKLTRLKKVICDKEKAVAWWPLKESSHSLQIIEFEEEPNLDWLRD